MSLSNKKDCILQCLNEKIRELKISFTDDITEEVHKLFEAQNRRINELESVVVFLQHQVEIIKAITSQQNENADNEGCELCVRVEGIPFEEKETSDDLGVIVRQMVNDVNKNESLKVPDDLAGRFYRVGPLCRDMDSDKEYKSLIIRFPRSWHRTIFHSRRNKLPSNFKVMLYSTGKGYEVFRHAQALAKTYSEKIQCVYMDKYGNIMIRLETGSEIVISDLDDLEKIAETLQQ